MNTKQIISIAALIAVTGSALADQAPSPPLTRAQVVQSVLDARAQGTLRHAGERAPEEDMEYARAHPSMSSLTRSQEKRSVLAARADGTLRHAGEPAPEEAMEYAQAHPSVSTLTRAQVNAQVLQARADGTLVPAGQGVYPASDRGGAEFAAGRARLTDGMLRANR